MNVRALVLPLTLSLACVWGCGGAEPPPRAATTPATTLPTSASVTTVNRNVYLSDDLAKACKIDFGNVEKAPKFDFDDSTLLPSDRDVLAQVAKCVTTGPLAGRSLGLVGRADPRGEKEYNMALGEHRAGSAGAYLQKLGVANGKIAETSRGALDATGTDSTSWARDRRVDIALR